MNASRNVKSLDRLKYRGDAIVRRLRARLWPRSYSKRRALRDHLAEVFSRAKIDCVFDVGANRGQYYRFLRHELGYKGLIVSFEPIFRLACELDARTVIDPNWRVFACGLGSRAGSASLNVMKVAEFSSLLAPSDMDTKFCSDMNAIEHVEAIPMRTLDDVVAELQSTHRIQRAYLKLDTQGFDLEVLRGADASLEHVVALQTELSFIPLYRGMVPWRSMLDEIQKREFDVSGFFPVVLDDRFRLIEADVVCVRRATPIL